MTLLIINVLFESLLIHLHFYFSSKTTELWFKSRDWHKSQNESEVHLKTDKTVTRFDQSGTNAIQYKLETWESVSLLDECLLRDFEKFNPSLKPLFLCSCLGLSLKIKQKLQNRISKTFLINQRQSLRTFSTLLKSNGKKKSISLFLVWLYQL